VVEKFIDEAVCVLILAAQDMMNRKVLEPTGQFPWLAQISV